MLWDVREDPLGEKSSSKSFREFRGRCASTCPTGASGLGFVVGWDFILMEKAGHSQDFK